MASKKPWITSFLEKHLSVYLQGSCNPDDYGDDGSNLRFSVHSEHSALINSWTEKEAVPTLNLTDSTTQIDAILSQEALEEYQKRAPDRPLGKNTVRGYNIQLLGFEVVLEYSTAEPNVHLYVQHFNIAWQEGKIRAAPQGKSIKRIPLLKKLMQSVFRRVKGPTKQGLVSNEEVDDSYGSQANQATQQPASQGILMSQIPSIAPSRNLSLPPSLLGSKSTDMLLDQLGTNSETAGAPRPFNDKAHMGVGTAAQLRSSQHSAEISRSHSLPREPLSATHPGQLQRPTETERLQASVEQSNIVRDSLSNENIQEAPIEAESEQQQLVGHVEESALSATEKGAASPQNGPSDKELLRPMNPPEHPRPSHADPWGEMSKIRTRDVRIPKEQAELLEQHRRRWIPPSPGESTPQGHVPPRLLDQWNKIALRRHMAKERELKGMQPEPPETHQSLPSIPSPTPQPDLDSEGENLSWSESEPEQESRPRQVLPEDSSPIRGRPKRVVEPSHPNDTYLPSEQSPRKASPEPGHLNNNSSQPMDEDQEDPDVAMRVSSPGADQPVNHNDATALDDTAHINGAQDESEEDSDESVMDTSVPCPLGNHTQEVQLTSQSEQEVASSGSSLPGPSTREHVQVVETPDINLRRHRLEGPSKSEHSLQPSRSGQVSSEKAKSSSQSLILNTYPKESSSQISDHDRAGRGMVSNDVDILGTRINSSLPIHDTASSTTSDMALDSSAPRPREASMSIGGPAHQSQTSNPFSSYREMPSSMPSEAEEQVGTSAKRPMVPSLKRLASEIAHEELSPTKRCKTEQDRQLIEPVFATVARGQSSVGQSTEKLEEAQNVYEKFRRDYPSYSGAFDYFTNLCSKLQAVRAQGHLKRSFLWDDFIIKHLEEYPHYLEQCLSEENKSLVYEEYFTSFFSKPSYKKRSLTAYGIDISAAQDIPTSQALSPDASVSLETPNNSFTGSLVDRLTNFHAHSFGPGTQDMQSDTDMEYLSCIMSSPTPQEKVCRGIPGPEKLPVISEQPMEVGREQESESDASMGEAEPDTGDSTRPQTPIADPVKQAESTDSGSETSETGSLTPDQQQLRQMLQSEQQPKPDVAENDIDSRQRGPAAGGQLESVKVEHSGSSRAESSSAEPSSAESDSEDEQKPSAVHEQPSSIRLGFSNPESQTEANALAAYDQRKAVTYLDSSIPESVPEPWNQAVHEQFKMIDLDSNIPESQPRQEPPAVDTETQAPDPAQHSQPSSSESESKSSHEDMDDETHETASIELGDGSQEANAAEAADLATESEAESEAESINENWFDSLRHMRPTGPVWSDDPHTPFKQWARADQNVLSERYRRGGASITVDEKGVTQRPEYRRQND
ncbi:hypothetical protein BO71DRAFT_371698 [Aspergillus ellipticus CBS 707.79]|uniref:Shelterin complex subunit TPP1/Est3 domain-containing protein n=1 Tax=Aspergillus ellipticus CBS 707.79 TaxID=1448320 RepID=A0A319E352_9EURO|nr:hypothetical protein BO71DRAFT_371698 [Aspergillus ellipticus CBS 707.79]